MQLGLTEGLFRLGMWCPCVVSLGVRPLWRFEKSDLFGQKFIATSHDRLASKKVASQPTPLTYPHPDIINVRRIYAPVPMDPSWGLRSSVGVYIIYVIGKFLGFVPFKTARWWSCQPWCFFCFPRWVGYIQHAGDCLKGLHTNMPPG